MLKTVEAPLADVAIIMARFQGPYLHEGWLDLIKSVCEQHQNVHVFLGLAPLKGTLNNPLDFESRKQMVLEKFPNINVLYIKDVRDDETWSKKVDTTIKDLITPKQTVILYGSRDSFICHYRGKYNTCELVPERIISGTEVRRKVGAKVRPTEDFRAGAIWQVFNRHPTCYATVDVAVFNKDETQILLARKPDETKYRFIGGFSDPESTSYEADAKREVREEAGIEISEPEYLGSVIVDDWRYREEQDKVKTILFKATYLFGAPKADDDIAEVRWIGIDEFESNVTLLVEEHRPLALMLLKKMTQQTLKEVYNK